MSPELDATLCERYPEATKNRRASKQESCMYYGFACGDGWFDIIDCMLATIAGHMKHKRETRAWAEEDIERWVARQKRWGGSEELPEVPEPFVLEQVKEKFGTLRVYASGGDAFCKGAVVMAESLSARTCETCGRRGEARSGGWIHVLCDEHAKEGVDDDR